MISKYKLRKISNNLDYYFNLASPSNIQEGLEWYKNAHNICRDLSNKYGYKTDVVAGILSALSPRNKWHKNIIDTETVLSAVQDKILPENVKVSTFHKNKFKAFAIAKSLATITEDSEKTYAFVQNIAFLDDNFVTCDVWHHRACFNKTVTPKHGLEYEQLVSITKRKAKEVGLKSFEYQAIIWASVQENF